MRDIVIDNIENFEDEELYEDEEFITPEQAIKVLNLFMNTCMMLPTCLAAFVGLRRSEIAGILKTNIDLQANKLIIKNTRVRCGKKTIFKKKNKNKTSTRALYLPKLMIDILNIEFKRQEKNREIYGDKYIDSKFLCVMDDGRPIRVDYISVKFKEVFDKFILEETEKAKEKGEEFNFPYITLHKLRHLNISSLLAHGAYITDVKDNAGHSCIQTTMHYTHNYTEGKQEIANKVDEIYTPLLNFKIS